MPDHVGVKLPRTRPTTPMPTKVRAKTAWPQLAMPFGLAARFPFARSDRGIFTPTWRAVGGPSIARPGNDGGTLEVPVPVIAIRVSVRPVRSSLRDLVEPIAVELSRRAARSVFE